VWSVDVYGHGCHTTAMVQRIRVKGQTYEQSCHSLAPNSVLLSKQNSLSSLVDGDPPNNDLNVFPNPHDSVTDSSMNPRLSPTTLMYADV
jgi:hypothetical protein